MVVSPATFILFLRENSSFYDKLEENLKSNYELYQQGVSTIFFANKQVKI